MSKVRALFLGTPEFAVPSLKALVEDEHFEVVGVLSQPDRPSGRKLQLTSSPVKKFALENGIDVQTPETLKNSDETMNWIRSKGPEIAVVVAYGQILSEEFLKSFTFGAVNVHGSLLPRWRGAAPIQRAIQFGDDETGVTLQRVVKKLDAGDIIGLRRVPISADTTSKDLFSSLAFLGADLLRVELMDFIRGNLGPHAQDESLVTYAKKIEKSESILNWQQTALELNRKIRAFNSGPGTYSLFRGQKIKFHDTMVDNSEAVGAEAGSPHDKNRKEHSLMPFRQGSPGEIVGISKDYFQISTGQGLLKIIEIQPESRNTMKASEFIRGCDLKLGEFFL